MATALAPANSGRIFRGVIAGLVIAALVIGLPIVLSAYQGAPWEWQPEWTRIRNALTHWPLPATALPYAIAILGWIAWAAITLAIGRDAILVATGRAAEHPAITPVRLLTAALVGTITATAPAWTANADTTTIVTAETCPAPAPQPPTDTQEPADQDRDDAHERDENGDIIETVDSDNGDPSDDTLWGMAEKHYGDGMQYKRIFEHNKGLVQSDGSDLTDEDHIIDGTGIVIPDTAPQTPPRPPTQDAPEPEPEVELEDPPSSHPVPEDQQESPTRTLDAPEASQGEEPALSRGGWISIGSFLALSVLGVVLARRRKHHRTSDTPTRPRPAPASEANPEPADDDDPISSRLIDLQELLEADDTAATEPSTAPVPLATGTNEEEEISILDYAVGGLGVTGPGSAAVVRGAVWSAVAAATTVVLDRDLAERLGLDLTVLDDIPSIHLTADDRDLATKARNAVAAVQYEPETDELHPNITVIIADREKVGALPTDLLGTETLYAVIHGTWDPAWVDVAADGTPRDARLDDLQIDHIGRCYLLEKPAANRLLSDLRDDHTPAPPLAPDEPSGSADPIPEPAPPEAPPQEAAAERFRLQLFGSHQLTWQGADVRFGRHVCLDLIAIMALTDTWSLNRDELNMVVAPDIEIGQLEKIRSRRTTALQETRKALTLHTGGDDLLVFDKAKQRYRLDHAVFHTDVADFDHHLNNAAETGDPVQRAEHLTTALQHYGGPLGADLDEIWDVTELRRQYQDAAYQAAINLAAHHEAQNQPEQAYSLLERACTIAPTNPEAWEQLADLHRRHGDEAKAEQVEARAQRMHRAGLPALTPQWSLTCGITGRRRAAANAGRQRTAASPPQHQTPAHQRSVRPGTGNGKPFTVWAWVPPPRWRITEARDEACFRHFLHPESERRCALGADLQRRYRAEATDLSPRIRRNSGRWPPSFHLGATGATCPW